MAESAVKGDLKAAAALFALAERAAQPTDAAPSAHQDQADDEIIASFLARQAPDPASGE
jgi:hypothetical protein